MSPKTLGVAGMAVVMALSTPSWGQAVPLTPLPPPPLVQVPMPPPMPPPQPPVSVQPGTPPPPSTLPPPGYQPNAPGYPYSPYGQAALVEKPGPEIGLMVSEALFGMLPAGGITALPYFLLIKPFPYAWGQAQDSTLQSLLMILIFSAAPLAVAQTQVSLANGSKYYSTEMWPAALAGLGGEAVVLGLFYLTGWLESPPTVGGAPSGGSEALLLIGSIAVVPLIQMAVINLTKQPKFRPAVLRSGKPGERVSLGLPSVAPILSRETPGLISGIQVSLLNGTF